MLIDTHAHVNFNAFKIDADDVIRRSLSNGTWMILVGTEYKTSKRALDFANKYERGVYAAVGLHPIYADKEFNVGSSKESMKTNGSFQDADSYVGKFNYDIYEKLAKFKKVVAVGEIGLDYYHINHKQNVEAIKKKQKDVFIQQFELARNLDLPVIIHCRQAHDDMIEILKKLRKKYRSLITKDKPWGVMHCFSGDEDLAWQYFSLGLLISFTGLITFSKQWDDLIRKVPLEKIMIETDCPYMTPEPYRNQRNEPILIKYVCKRISEIKNIDLERVAEITTKNAKELFRI